MSVIHVTNLTFSYEGSYDNVFENVSFQIDTDWRLGFTGRNGRGKTTFLHLLMGKYPYSGTISSNVKFQYFPYPVQDISSDVLEIMSGICPTAEDWEMIREISLLDVSPDVLYRPFETLSHGERTKVLLAALFLNSDQFLLLDEPTNHLDFGARKLLGEYLKRKKGFILVSHDRALLDNCVDHILSINRTNIEIQRGNFSTWWQNKRLQDEFELAQNTKLQKEIGRLSQAAKRSANWSDRVETSKRATTNSGLRPDKGYIGHQSAKMMKRAKSQTSRMQHAAEEKAKLLHNVEESHPLKLMPLKYPKDILAEAADLSLFYHDSQVCADIQFQIHQGDRIAVVGKNGCGKSTLLKLVCGEDIQHSGTLMRGSHLKISYVAQDTAFLKGGLRDYAKACNIDESLFKSILRKLGFDRVQFEKCMESFSEGQKKKVLLAKSLCEPAHLYVWDEPLNFIDVLSRMQLETLLLHCQPTLLFVEHDIAFQEHIATGTISL